MKWEEVVKIYSDRECESDKFSKSGRTFYSDNENYKGYYWFYEAKDFIIDIHSFYMKRDCVFKELADIREKVSLQSNYIFTASGEMLTPYKRIESDSMFIMESKNLLDQKCAVHGKSSYVAVGIKFAESMIERYIVQGMKIEKEKVFEFFCETQNSVTREIRAIANEIMECKLTGVAAELFFEEKAKEWLRITIEAYEKKSKEKKLSEDDKISIERVAKYIDDHYFLEIKQNFLEELAYMSSTKLKTVFKKRYNMSITEYTQRKRMDIAENLLLTTDLEIKDVAKAVGYKSHSRFTTLFKRYKAVYPKELKRK